jgi:hypothetical protein
MQDGALMARANRLGSPLANFTFFASWIALCAHLAQRWHFIDSGMRADMEFLTLIFLLLWINLLIEKTKIVCLGLVCGSFWSVLALVFRFI